MPTAGMALFSFDAGSDADAETVAQQVSTILGVGIYLHRTDVLPSLLASYTPASQGSSLGNSVTGVEWSPL
jgi:hypothetical protein